MSDADVQPLDLFRPAQQDDRRRRLAEALDQLEDRFPRGRVTRARLVGEGAAHRDGSETERSLAASGKAGPGDPPPLGTGDPGPALPPRPAAQFISQSLTPITGSFNPEGMESGEPGLPVGFSWKGRECRIRALLERWKGLGPEPTGEIYLRRHYYRLGMEDGSTWTVYCLRQAPRRKSGAPSGRGSSSRRSRLQQVTAPPPCSLGEIDRPHGNPRVFELPQSPG